MTTAKNRPVHFQFDLTRDPEAAEGRLNAKHLEMKKHGKSAYLAKLATAGSMLEEIGLLDVLLSADQEPAYRNGNLPVRRALALQYLGAAPATAANDRCEHMEQALSAKPPAEAPQEAKSAPPAEEAPKPKPNPPLAAGLLRTQTQT